MRRFAFILSCAFALASCSTTRILQEGEYRLEDNLVKISGKSPLKTSDISPYIRQQANSHLIFGIAPAVSIYNWSDGSGKGLSKIWEKIGKPPVIYNPETVSASVDNITERLHYLGYYSPSIKTSESFHGKKVKVSYVIDPGARKVIDTVKYNLPDDEVFLKYFTVDTTDSYIHRGAFISESLVEQEITRATANFRNCGYYDFSKNDFAFVADTISFPGKVIFNYNINTKPERYTFGNVTVARPSDMNFRESVIRDMITITPGSLYNDDDVNRTYSRLASLRIFNSVTVRTQAADSLKVNCDISMTRSRLKGVRVNLEGSATTTGLFGISPQMTFYNKNLFHGGEWFTLGFTGNFQFKPNENTKAEEYSINSGLSFPKPVFFGNLFKKNPYANRTEIKASFNFQNRPEFNRRVIAFSFGYSGIFGKRLQYNIYPVQINTTHLKDISESYLNTLIYNPQLYYAYSDHFDLGLGASFHYTTNSDIVPTVPFHYYRLIVETSGNFLSLFNNLMPVDELGQRKIFNLPYSQYIRGEFVFGRTWRFGRSSAQSLAIRADIGAAYAAYGNYVSVPFEKQFYVGGASSMRGWQARCLGPGAGEYDSSLFAIPSQSGEFKLEFDAEYRFKLFWKLEGALFAETGNVWNFGKDFFPDEYPEVFRIKDFYKSLAADWGVGLRLNLNFIILRFDFGMRIHDPSRSDGPRWVGPDQWLRAGGNAFHFGVGYPF